MVKKNPPMSGELGTSGLNRFGGYIQEEFLTVLQGQRGRRIYDEMRSNDAIVGAILFAIEMALRQVPWYALPENTKEAKFLESCMHDMSHTWADFISEALLMLPYGYSWFEIVYRKRQEDKSKYNDGLIGWRKFGYRSPDSLNQWKFDEAGGIEAFIQSAPPDYKITEIPIEKSILFRTRREKNNPEGRSILRTAYRSWYFKKNLEALEGISLERIYAGFPLIKLPQGASDGDISKAKDIVRKVRVDEQMGIVLPQGWDFQLMGSEGRGVDAYDKAIIRYRQEIMLSVIASFIALGIEKAGSYALARETKDFFQLALEGWLGNIKETINQFAVPKLLKLNNLDPQSAHIESGKVGQVDLEKMSNYIQRLSQSFALDIDDDLKRYLREAAGLPQSSGKPQEPPEEKPPEGEEQPEVGKAEDWHPQIKKRPVTLKEMQEAEEGIERSVRRFFLRQRKWIGANWKQLLPKGKSDLEKQEYPTDWKGWETEFAKEIERPMGKAMELGARTAQEEIPGIAVDWSLYSPESQQFIRQHSLELAKNINKVTKDRLRSVLATGLQLGEGRDKLALRVRAVSTDASIWRSRMIAQTETMTAYNKGSLQLYRQGGIKKKQWLDGQEGACEECEALDGVIVGINETFPGGYDAPVAHPGCRCSIVGVTE